MTSLSSSELRKVLKPAQYLGGEIGSVVKRETEVDINFCLAFPDTYEVGMSHVGIQILYGVLNRDPRIWAERVYTPLPDMEELLRKKGIPLTSLEGGRPLNKFDLVGFSLQYELCSSGILTILELGGIELLAAKRTDSSPLIIGGGPVAYHPEPLSDFFDAFLIGDGEDFVPEFVSRYRTLKQKGVSRSRMLRELSKMKGVYIPSFFTPVYDQRGKFNGFKREYADYTSVTRRIIPSLAGAPYPVKPVVPAIKAVHDRLSVEVMRGCVRGCRFCQAGYLYRPQRERKPEEVLKIVEESIPNTGYEELSLLSLSTADYCSVLPVISVLKERYCANDNMVVSFPSTRVDALKPELLREVQSIRRAGFTLAPEAGTQRLRDVINKGVSDEEIIETCRNVFNLGWSHIKLYFMIGLPTETDEDLLGIIDIAKRVKALTGPRQKVTVSVSTLVPKPHTPFQWTGQISVKETIRRQHILKSGLKRIGVVFRSHRAFSTFLEGVFARGDRRLSAVVLKAYRLGCRLDGWVEELNEEKWLQAFSECGIDPESYLKEREITDSLPWDQISCEIPKGYFIKEWQRALRTTTTPDCLHDKCSGCRVCDYKTVQNMLFDRKETESRLKIVNPPCEAPPPEETGERAESVSLLTIDSEDSPEFGSGSLDYIPQADKDMDYPFKTPAKPVLIHENTPLSGTGKALRQRPVPPVRAEVPVVQRVRFRYRKSGNATFVGHLELASIFFRAARRANVPIAFSRGFNPKPKIIFGPPLQLGIESESEYVDIFLTKKTGSGELFARYRETLPPGIDLLEAAVISLDVPPLQNEITSQTYSCTPSKAHMSEALDAIRSLAGSKDSWRFRSVERVKKGKKKTIRLSDAVLHLKISQSEIIFEIRCHQTKASLKPVEVLDALTGGLAFCFRLRKTGAAFCESELGAVDTLSAF